jgi:hypothetical protein
MHQQAGFQQDSIIEDATEWTDEEQDYFSSPSDPTKIAPMKSLQQFQSFGDEDVEDVSGTHEDEALSKESLLDRVIALKYIFPLSFRKQGYKFFVGLRRVWKRVWGVAGHASWIVTTSLILVGLPMFIEYDREQGMMAFEKEQQKAEQLL